MTKKTKGVSLHKFRCGKAKPGKRGGLSYKTSRRKTGKAYCSKKKVVPAGVQSTTDTGQGFRVTY